VPVPGLGDTSPTGSALNRILKLENGFTVGEKCLMGIAHRKTCECPEKMLILLTTAEGIKVLVKCLIFQSETVRKGKINK